MKKLMIELLKYIQYNYPANYGVKIEIEGHHLFMVTEGDENLTISLFIANHYLKGKELNLKNDFYIFTNYNTVKIIKKEFWIEYWSRQNKDDFALTFNDQNEILVIDKQLILKNDETVT